MSNDSLLEERFGSVALLRLNRPDSANALNESLIDALVNRFTDISGDPSVGAVVITGQGSTFCSGGDRRDMVKRLKVERTAEQMVAGLTHRARVSSAVRSMPQPTVAALNGATVGAGLSLACAADYRIASTAATLCTVFSNLGLSGDYGISWSLPRIVGEGTARRLLALAETVDAVEAHRIGLVDEVFEASVFDELALDFARRLAARSREALRAIDANLADARSLDFDDLVAVESRRQAVCAEFALSTNINTTPRSLI